MSGSVRPTKKQRELLTFIGGFITEHGYSPSYREIMNGLGYTSVATISLHVNNLIRRGHLRKRDHSARSLELADGNEIITKPQADWFLAAVEERFALAEAADTAVSLAQLEALADALAIVGHQAAARYAARLLKLSANL